MSESELPAQQTTTACPAAAAGELGRLRARGPDRLLPEMTAGRRRKVLADVLAAARSDLWIALPPWIVARAVVLATLAFVHYLGNQVSDAQPGVHLQVTGLLGWDAAYYRDIAEHGYAGLPADALRFFPLVPAAGSRAGGRPRRGSDPAAAGQRRRARLRHAARPVAAQRRPPGGHRAPGGVARSPRPVRVRPRHGLRRSRLRGLGRHRLPRAADPQVRPGRGGGCPRGAVPPDRSALGCPGSDRGVAGPAPTRTAAVARSACRGLLRSRGRCSAAGPTWPGPAPNSATRSSRCEARPMPRTMGSAIRCGSADAVDGLFHSRVGTGLHVPWLVLFVALLVVMATRLPASYTGMVGGRARCDPAGQQPRFERALPVERVPVRRHGRDPVPPRGTWSGRCSPARRRLLVIYSSLAFLGYYVP